MREQIHVGTSGWSYKHWKDVFYPPKLAATKWLPFYTTVFHTTEINGSFYRLPSEDTVKKWVETVPDDFVFCPKMSRYLTHMKKLREPEEPLERFFSIFEYMKQKMGPILIQLPEMLRFNYEIAEAFYRLLKFQYKAYEFVMEVRHDSWLQEESLTLMTKYNLGLVISQSGGFFPYSEIVTAKNIYVRFHGPADLYASPYSNEMLKAYAKKFSGWVAEGHEVWAYFNNDIHAHAVRDAQRLMALL
ncbi:MAG: DUF72 domain-containing protein [Chitinophagaceae bacterium]|nr:MAG: DUF72 domain-containing protein [Chitinophagaceae bacterium]